MALIKSADNCTKICVKEADDIVLKRHIKRFSSVASTVWKLWLHTFWGTSIG